MVAFVAVKGCLWSKRAVASSGFVVTLLLSRFAGGRYCQFGHEHESACYFHYNEGHSGALHACDECRRFFGQDEFERRRTGRGNEPLY